MFIRPSLFIFVAVYVVSSSSSLDQYLPLIKVLTKTKSINIVSEVNEVPENCLTNRISDSLVVHIPVKVSYC